MTPKSLYSSQAVVPHALYQVSGEAEETILARSDASDAGWVPAYRAAGVAAVEAITEALQPSEAGPVTARQVEAYLRTVELKKLSGNGGPGLEVPVLRGTVFF